MIVFLDFDGVLHPELPSGRTNDDYLFCRLPSLESWLRDTPEVDVVISSSWRESYSFSKIVSFFAEDVKGRVLGCTPVLSRAGKEEFGGELPPLRFPREAEVLHWLAASAEPWRPWAALDDQVHLFKPFNPRVIICDPTVGLTAVELRAVDAVFGIARRNCR